MTAESNGRFDLDQFVGDYKESMEGHAAVIGGAFVVMQGQLDQINGRLDGTDGRLDRIERVLERAFPDEYAEVNGER